MSKPKTHVQVDFFKTTGKFNHRVKFETFTDTWDTSKLEAEIRANYPSADSGPFVMLAKYEDGEMENHYLFK